MFVTTSVAQALAFASKVATAMVIPQIAAFISIYSSRKAIQLSFFSSISNCISVLLDTRSWQHDRNIPKFPTKVSILSWFTILASILLYGIVVASDLLVFQLAKRHTEWKYYPNSNINLNFDLAEAKITDNFNVSAPLALVDDKASIWAFQNNSYIPAEHYVYLQEKPLRTLAQDGNTHYELIYEVNNVTSNDRTVVNRNFTCYCAQQVEGRQVANGLPLVSLRCETSITPGTAPYYPSIGFNKKTNVMAYQADEGAHFSFMTSKQRDKQRINETDNYPTTTRKFLERSVQNYTLIGQQHNGTAVDLDLDNAFDFLSRWKNGTKNYGVILTYYKIDSEIMYGKVPVHTYNYLILEMIGLAGPQDPADFYAIPGLIYFNFISYSVQNVFVPEKKIDKKYLGIDEEGIYGPRSTSILTDEPPEHVIIAMLANPQRPIMIRAVEMIDAWPALLLIIFAGGISFLLFVVRFIHQITSSIRLSFDPRLEIFHSAVDDWKTNSADSLLIKMQESDLVMVNGYSPDVDGNKIGLVPEDTVILPFQDQKLFK